MFRRNARQRRRRDVCVGLYQPEFHGCWDVDVYREGCGTGLKSLKGTASISHGRIWKLVIWIFTRHGPLNRATGFTAR